jgi:subtilisin family serine protease
MPVVTGALLLAACGGGGGTGSAGSNAPPVSTPAPTPTPTPTPTPPATSRSAEYRASGAVTASNAGAAYDRGITGKGVTIAVLDTGFDVQGAEFQGRISPDSTGFDQQVARCATCAPETVRFALDDVIGHGTEVASIAAGARNEAGMHGVAPEATILALKISGPDLSNVPAGSTTPIPEGENANSALIAPAIRYAVEKGAFVVTLALNGTSGGQIATDQRAAMDQVRTADRLVVQSVSNFTGEDSFTGQIAGALVGADRANADWFLFAIGVTEDGRARATNGNAGPLDARTLSATGNDVQAVGRDGALVTVTGNSFAAPAIAGAAALLKQYWPQLGGRAIGRILLDTATDAGAPGVDPVFGVGIMNVERAMQAQAPAASFAAAQVVLARYSSLTVSAPFGGSAAAQALAGRLGSMTVFDRYGRDYALTGDPGVRARGSGLLASGTLSPVDPLWSRGDAGGARLGVAASGPVGPWQSVSSNRPAIVSFSPAGGQTATVAANVAIAAGGGLSGSALRGIASTPVGVSTSWAGSGWSGGFSSGSSRDGRSSLDLVRMGLPVGIGLELSNLRERGQALGLSAGAGLGIEGGRTRLATITASRAVAGVTLTGRATVGRTRVEGGSDLLRFAGPVVSTAFQLEAARPAFGGLMTLGLSSPLRVERARASLDVPVAYDLIGGTLATERRTFDLSPTARELDLELGWSAALSPSSSLRLGVARAFDAGHVAGATDTAGFLALVVR